MSNAEAQQMPPAAGDDNKAGNEIPDENIDRDRPPSPEA